MRVLRLSLGEVALKGVPGLRCIFRACGSHRWKVAVFGKGRRPCCCAPLPGSRCCRDQRRNERVSWGRTGASANLLLRSDGVRVGRGCPYQVFGTLGLPSPRLHLRHVYAIPLKGCSRSWLLFWKPRETLMPTRWWHHLFPVLTSCFRVSPEAWFSNSCWLWKWQKTPSLYPRAYVLCPLLRLWAWQLPPRSTTT